MSTHQMHVKYYFHYCYEHNKLEESLRFRSLIMLFGNGLALTITIKVRSENLLAFSYLRRKNLLLFPYTHFQLAFITFFFFFIPF